MGESPQVRLDPRLTERFARELDGVVAPDAAIGVAISGGPDSIALLLLAAAVRPGKTEAATVDHGLRRESRDEAEFVAKLCERIGVPHRILTASWGEKPTTAVQERARRERYWLLGGWAGETGVRAVLTGHHLEDQAETFLMRLMRGAGARGLGGMRPVAEVPGCTVPLVRPLLGWHHAELEALCAAAGVQAIHDPSNEDERFERVRVRKALAEAEWLGAQAIAASASNLADADEALDWASEIEWRRSVSVAEQAITYSPGGAPREILRRIVLRAITGLATEGNGAEPRGREVDQLLSALLSGNSATLRGVHCSGGDLWRFRRAPPRRSA